MKQIKSIPFLLVFLFASVLANSASEKKYQLNSPDKRMVSEIIVGDFITFNLKDDKQIILETATIAMEFQNDMNWGKNARVKSDRFISVTDNIVSPFYKKALVKDQYNQLSIGFKEGFTLIFRMYNDGLAYRFAGNKKGKFIVKNEVADYRLTKDFNVYAPYVRDRKKTKNATFEQQFWNDMQNLYTYSTITNFNTKNLLFTPILVELDSGEKLCIAEADLENYPGMYLNNDNVNPGFKGVFAGYPKTLKQGGHNELEMLVTERESYIACVDGTRNFPWRTFIVTQRDEELVECDMIYRLASPSRVVDNSWIKPGKVAWEWWNKWGLYNVDFRAGINTETYKYYIDFASTNDIEYVILDEGWATKYKCDLLDVIPEIDLPEIISYAEKRNVGIILWAGYLAMENNLEAVVKHYSEMGVKGFKIDFLNRDDQKMLDFMYRTADVCAKYRMLVNYHGVCKPAGLQRTYPNVINYEAVFGLEQMKWSSPETDMVTYDVTLPFIRMVAGPMDYTQGAMRNSIKGDYYPDYSSPMSQGTRCHQLAEYIVFESPMNMLCDSPSNYMKENECMSFISDIPTVWDDTKVISGEVSKYVVVARRSGDNWYVGALNGWDERELTVTLPENCHGKNVEIFRDGINADRTAQDYKREIGTVPANGIMNIKLAPGGGWAAKILK